MNVLIVTGFFSPHNTPRAFRSTELALELSRRGVEVDIVNAIPFVDYDYKLFNGINLINVTKYSFFKLPKYYINPSTSATKVDKLRRIKQCIAKLVYYFTAYTFFELYFAVVKQLKMMSSRQYDLVISIGLPVQCHFAVSHCVKKGFLKTYKSIADYGDPFSVQQDLKIAPYFKSMEKSMLRYFDFISVPVSSAVESYLPLIEHEKIRVIPQGFNFSNIVLSKYTINAIPTFGFAGNLYLNVRNPHHFLDYLSTLKTNFRFILYTSLTCGDSYAILKSYIDVLGHKLVIFPIIPREEVLFELSKMDFLVNFANITTNQSPSKLIDYALTERPILNIETKNFSPLFFDQFLLGDYTNQTKIDVSEYDIKNICNSFLNL